MMNIVDNITMSRVTGTIFTGFVTVLGFILEILLASLIVCVYNIKKYHDVFKIFPTKQRKYRIVLILLILAHYEKG